MGQTLHINFAIAETTPEPKTTSENTTETTTFGEKVDALAEANVETAKEEVANPILPVGAELAWGAASFIVLWALMKFVLLKPIMQAMADRAEKVRSDLEAAEQARESATTATSDYEASLTTARAEAGRIIDDARAQAEERRKELIAAAEAEVAQMRAAATADIAAAKAAAMSELRPSLATIAVEAAQSVMGKPLDAAAQRPIVDAYLDRVGSQN